MHPYRDNEPPVKLNRTKARIRGFIRRILLPTCFVGCFGLVALVGNLYFHSRLHQIEAELTKREKSISPVVTEAFHYTTPAPVPAVPPPGIFYETTSSFNGVEVSRVFDSKNNTTCYVVNDQRRGEQVGVVPVAISCIKGN